MYRADVSDGHCMVCVKGRAYKHDHVKTRVLSSKYFNRKQARLDRIKNKFDVGYYYSSH